MGTVMDDISVVVLTTPILMPVITELGFNPIHYAAIVGVNTALGCIMPPCAPVLYLSGRLSNTPIDQIMKPTLKFIAICWIPALIFVTYFPRFVLFLPNLIMGTPWFW
jgi:TRAP-type C4-dicarboxylate transport system permease large subunit